VSVATQVVPEEVLAALRGSKQAAIAGHVTPDADCIGSIGALWLALPELGVTPHASLPPESVARRMTYLVELAGLNAASETQLADCDILIAVDTAKQPRLNLPGDGSALDGKPIVNIDHHATNTQFGQWNWIEGRRSSTAEMVFEVLTALDCQITPTIGTLLLAGIHTDTQGFSLHNTTARSLAVAHALVEAGADIHAIGERMHRSQSKHEFDLMKVIYGNTQVVADGKIAYSTASHAEITAAGCNANDIDDQVEVPRSIDGIHIAVLMTEGNPGKVRMNFRGEQGLSILELARQFNGGGHHGSAGAIVDGTVDEVAPRIIAAAEEYLNQAQT
jgi:phosphoesterase RecJ-like protein